MSEPAFILEVRQEGPIPFDARITGAAGELLVLVGPSGAGKSTLLRTIAGLYTPAHGRVHVAGECWLDVSAGIVVAPDRRRVGFVFQQHALFPHMTALGNIKTALGHQPRKAQDGIARQLLASVHLNGRGDRLPSQLSGGEQQRVAIARALAREPAILLLDEPFSSVDHRTREELYHELETLKRGLRIPAVLVTHDLDEAARLADRMVLLERGNTIQAGTPADVMHSPISLAAARLLGVTNIFAATVEGIASETVCLRWAGQMLNATSSVEVTLGEKIMWCVRAGAIEIAQNTDASNVLLGRWFQLRESGDARHGRMMIEGREELLDVRLPLGSAAIEKASVRVHLPPAAIRILSA